MSTRERRLLFLLVLLAAVVRTVVSVLTVTLQRDSLTFLELAGRAAAGDWHGLLAADQHPLYPVLLAVAGKLAGSFFRDPELGGRCLAVLAGSLSLVPLYFLARRLVGRRAAAWACLAYAITPYPVRFSSTLLSDPIYCLFFLVAVERGLALICELHPRDAILAAISTGGAAGLAYLTRPEGVGPMVVAGGFLAAAFVARRGLRGSRFVAGAAMALSFLAVAGPYLVYLRADTGLWTLTRKKSVGRLLAPPREDQGALPPGAGGVSSPALACLAPGLILGQVPPNAGGPVLRHIGELVSRYSETLHPWFLVFAILGLVPFRPRRGWGYVAAYLALYGTLLYGLSAGYGYLDRRHVASLAVLTLPWAGLGLSRTAARLRGWGLRSSARWVLVVTLAVVLSQTIARQGLRNLPERRAGEAVLSAVGPGRTIYEFGAPLMPYYGRGRGVQISDELMAAVLDRGSPRVTHDGIYTVPASMAPGLPPGAAMEHILSEAAANGATLIALDPTTLRPEAAAVLTPPRAFPLFHMTPVAGLTHVEVWEIGAGKQ